MKILRVLTSHSALGNTGKKTGFWLEEFAAPYYVFKDAGADITLASPAGGQPPLDPKVMSQMHKLKPLSVLKQIRKHNRLWQIHIFWRKYNLNSLMQSFIQVVMAHSGT